MGKTRAIAPPDEKTLEAAAIHYLERYSSSLAGLRRVLRRRIRRAARFAEGEGVGQGLVAAGDAMVESVLGRLTQTGLVDDGRYAEFRAGSLARRGASLSAIRNDLRRRGVAAPLIEAALAALKREIGSETNDETDRVAALALARRRHLGPFRSPAARAAHRNRDLATLGRAGFAFEIARAVIDGDPDNG